MGVRRYGLRDDEWDRIEDHLPDRIGSEGRPARDNRLFVEAVLYRYRAGVPSRDLPERFGDFRVVHTRFSRWAYRGVWKLVFEHMAAEADNEATLPWMLSATRPACTSPRGKRAIWKRRTLCSAPSPQPPGSRTKATTPINVS
jgi:transposase